MTGLLMWYRNWKQRRAEARTIREVSAFLNKWQTYDQKKAEEAPLVEHPFAAKVAALKQQVAKSDPYKFDRSVRQLVNGDAPNVPHASDEELIDAAANRMNRRG